MASKRVVRDGDALVKGSTYEVTTVSRAYSDMIKFTNGSQMWVDPGQIIDGWYFADGAHASAPQGKDCKPRGVLANQILLHMSMSGLSWSTGPDLLLPPDAGMYMHEDGTPISLTVEDRNSACHAAGGHNVCNRGCERCGLSHLEMAAESVVRDCDEPVRIDYGATMYRHTRDGEIVIVDKAYSIHASTIARRIFDADSRTKLAMSKLEVPQNDRAYARGIFGYQPEASWAADAWALTEEITK